MAILRITSLSGRIFCPDAPAVDARLHLKNALERLPDDAPVTCLIHGFRFHPADVRTDPHRLLFAPEQTTLCKRHPSWPCGLGFQEHGYDDGLCIAFAWEGFSLDRRRIIPRIARFSQIYARAGGTAGRLARLLNWIAELAPERRVDILAHSLGARVALQCLPRLEAPVLGRVILMGAAEYKTEVKAMMADNRHNPGAEFFNITARENDMFDFLFEKFAPTRHRGDRALGSGLDGPMPNWLDMQIDHPETAHRLAYRGVRLDTSHSVIDHWGFYMRDGMFRLYQNLIRDRQNWQLRDLHFELERVAREPRWSRMMNRPGIFKSGRSGA